MIDTHCHIQFNAFKDDADEVIKRCMEKGVILNVVGSQIDTSERAVAYAEKYDNIYATVGLHPVHLFELYVDEEEMKFKTREENFDYEKYKKLASHPKVIGIGECGLELRHLPEGLNREEVLEKQTEAFTLQYKLAQELVLPLVIHVRDAYEEMAELLEDLTLPSPSKGEGKLTPPLEGEVRGGLRGVVHCYTGNWQNARKFLDLGLYLGFTGVITFPPKKTDLQAQADLLEVVKNCPLDRVLIETDAPYLAPQAYRGQRCEPWMVEEVAKKIAEIKNLNYDHVSEITTKNAKNLFFKNP